MSLRPSGLPNGRFYEMKKKPQRTLVADTLTRISYLVGIFKAPTCSIPRRSPTPEVAFHKSVELAEIDWRERETVTYDDYLADFSAELHDIRDEARFADCLAPGSYAASRRRAQRLLDAGSLGIAYPSVRRKGGTCVACLRPAPQGADLSLCLEGKGGAGDFGALSAPPEPAWRAAGFPDCAALIRATDIAELARCFGAQAERVAASGFTEHTAFGLDRCQSE
jgi:hypothetical protein